ncbi:MAG: hypothetical protein AB8G11_01185 [Saprospiraceae bacterium]
MKKRLILLILIGYSVIDFSQNDSTSTIKGTVWDDKSLKNNKKTKQILKSIWSFL